MNGRLAVHCVWAGALTAISSNVVLIAVALSGDGRVNATIIAAALGIAGPLLGAIVAVLSRGQGGPPPLPSVPGTGGPPPLPPSQ